MRDGVFAPAPVWGELSTFSGRPWAGIDFIAAGWPCRPFSTASRGRAREEDQWRSVRRVVSQARPQLVFLENVPRAPWGSVGDDLSRLGYRVASRVVCPSSLGAPHRRPRGFLLAHSDRQGKPRRPFDEEMARLQAVAGPCGEDGAVDVGVDDGMARRMDRLRACGDGVVPLAAAYAFRSLATRLMD